MMGEVGVGYADLRGEIYSGRLEQEVIDRSISTGIFGALKNFTTQFSEGVTRTIAVKYGQSITKRPSRSKEGCLGQLESHKINRRTGLFSPALKAKEGATNTVPKRFRFESVEPLSLRSAHVNP